MSARHQKTRVLLCARRLVLLFMAAAASDGVRYKFQNYKQRVKQNNEFGPIRAPENNDFWRPTTAKLPLPVQVSSPQPTKHAFHIPICSGLIPLHNPQISYVQSYTIKYENQYIIGMTGAAYKAARCLGDEKKKKRQVVILGSCLPCFFFVHVPGTWYWIMSITSECEFLM